MSALRELNETISRGSVPLEGSPAAVLPWLLRIQLWAAQSTHDDAINKAIACRAPAKAVRIMQSPSRILKAPVGANTTHDPDYQSAVDAFIESESMRKQSLFFYLLGTGGLVRLPLRTRVGFTATPPVAAVVVEGAAKPLVVGPLSFLTLEPAKVAAPDVFTNEMLDDVSSAGQRYLASRLQAAVATTIDGEFLAAIVDTGTTSVASGGTAATNAWKDLRAVQSLVCTAGAGRYYYCAAQDVANKASTLADSAGAAAFPTMSASGGTLANLPCLVSAGLPSGTLALIDASAIVGNSDTIEMRKSTQADMLMSSTPNMSSAVPTPATMSSLWQNNCTGYIAEASFAAQVMRDDAVALVTGINWGA